MTNHLSIAFDDLFQYKDFIQAGKWGHSPFGIEVALPNLARLEARSTNFRRASATIPICNPSRASIMSGFSPYETGVFNLDPVGDWVKPEHLWTYHLRRAGYWMGTIGKIFHGYVPQPASVYAALYDSTPFTVIWNPSGDGIEWGGMYGKSWDDQEDRYYDAMVSDGTAAFLQSRNPADGPWHWECGFHHPHNPWYAPTRIYESLDLDDIIMPADWPLAWDLLPFPRDFVGMGQQIGTPSPSTWTPDEIDYWRRSVRNYIAAVVWADEKLGVVLDALEASPFNDDTLITCWSDHGYHLGDKDRWHKFTLWEESCNAPFMVSRPGQTVAREVWDPVSLIDIGKTVCDILGVDLPSHYRGVSLKPFCEGGTMPERMVPSFNYGSASGAIGPWRVSVYQDETFEFYNVMTDPWLKDNIALREPTNPLFLQYRDMLYETCREWGLDLVTDGAILRPGTPFTSFLGWEPPEKAITNSIFLIGDVEEMARTPNYLRMYQAATPWRGVAQQRIVMPTGVGFLNLTDNSENISILGNADSNVIVLSAGKNRTVDLGDGDDILTGVANSKSASLGGRVLAYGGRGNDWIGGSDGLNWEQPHDTLYGGAGNDTLMGYAGNDYLDGGAGDDSLDGGSGNDTLIAGAGNDTLIGGTGNDLLIVTGGSHRLTGGSDADVFRIMRTGQLQTITDLTSADTLDLSDWAGIQPVIVTQVGSTVEVTAALERIVCLSATRATVVARITGASVA